MKTNHLNSVTKAQPSVPRMRLTSLWLDNHGNYDPVAARGVTASAIAMALGMGADKDARDARGDTALVLAAQTGNAEVVQALLGAGERPGEWSSSGRTALMAAVNHADVVRVLLAAGANPDARDAMGRTALMMASYTGNVRSVRLLLAAGANPDIRLGGGDTALTVATAMKRPDIVRALILAGTDVTLKDHLGQTALATATRNGDTATVVALADVAGHGRHLSGSPGATATDRAMMTAALPSND